MKENIQKGEISKAYESRAVHAMNVSVGITFFVTVAVSLFPMGEAIALAMGLLFLTPVAIFSYTYW
jgi:hypothetical protein